MCGIFGVWYLDGTRVDAHAVQVSRDSIEYRGPDAAGQLVQGNVALAHRRLSIIDLSEAGRQPLGNEDGSIHAVVNGEVYNYQPLREQLLAAGHRFRGGSDSEVLLHAYAEWGTACFARFNGMFAAAIWDQRQQRLVLARDPFGKKPLYYQYLPGKRILFGSTLRPLMAWPDFDKRVDRNAIHAYLQSGYIPAPQSAFEHTCKLLPGHVLTLSADGKLEQQAYWDLPALVSPRKRRIGIEQATSELDGRLREAVRLRLVSDVPVGAFLSGGVDSSLIVALMKQFSSSPVRTFTIGFSDSEFDESQYAHAVAHELGVENDTLRMSSTELLGLVDEVSTHYDEPMADFSLLPTLAVSRFAKQQVKVVLTGDGGDEVFAGYNGYLSARIAEQYYRFVPARLRHELQRVHTLLPARYAAAVSQTEMPDAAHFYGAYKRIDRALDVNQLLRDPERAPPEQESAHMLASYAGLPLAERAQLFDLTHSMVDTILHKLDRATMATGLEARCPLLDKNVVQFSFELPLEHKLHRTHTKYILKHLLARYLPARLTERRKQGFVPPLRDWLRGPLRARVNELLCHERLAARGYVHPAPTRRIIQSHLDGNSDHTRLIWALLSLEAWHEHYLEPKLTACPSAA
jgi:asparagine synthase (glutamine-hydrolysing)